jgi:pimeloyl-ACP methyl ester carboxylesterase
LYTDVLGTWGPDGRSRERKQFAALVEAATKEITGRYPDYFSHFGIEVQSIAELARTFRQLPAFQQFCMAELELALVRGLQVFDSLHVPINFPSAECDDISLALLESVLDAYAAVRGSIALIPPPGETGTPPELPDERCTIEETACGVRYALSKGSGPPLLIISTTGAPLRIWSTLFHDPDLSRPCLSIQSRAGSFLEGGTPNNSSLLQDVADIRQVLLAKDLDQVDVVAWCNGARAAIALAREEPRRVASLMLLSPTFYSTMDADKYPSPFEDQLVSAYGIVESDEEAGRNLINSFTELEVTEPGQLPRSPEKRVYSVLRLPPYARVKDLLIPLSSIEYFKNYIDRVLGDETYDVRLALPEVRCPIVLVVGTHDAAINTQLARDLLTAHGRDVVQVTLFGAGHHIHLLQYVYFRYLIDHLGTGVPSVRTARLSVERLTPPQ